MPGYTSEEIRNIFNNDSGVGMEFNDTIARVNLYVYPLENSFMAKTIKDGEVRKTGRVVWSVYHQAFVGNDYNIPMGWRV